MDYLPKTLQYTPGQSPQLFDLIPRRELFIWTWIEAALQSLSGKRVVMSTDPESLLIAQKNNGEFIFTYVSQKEMLLTQPGSNESPVDFATLLNDIFARLNKQFVVIEADDNHFKICLSK